MDDISPLQPLQSAGCDNHMRQCCCSAPTVDATIYDGAPRKCGCTKTKSVFSKSRQISVTSGDSGIVMSLDPINEHENSSEVDIEENGCVRLANSGSFPCEHHGSHDRQHCCAQEKSVSTLQISDGAFTSMCCEHRQPIQNEKRLTGNRCSELHMIGRSQSFGNGRIRTRSESGLGDKYLAVSRNFSTLNCHHKACCVQNRFAGTPPTMEKNQQRNTSDPEYVRRIYRRPYQQLCCFVIFCTIISLCSVGITVFACSNKRLHLEELEGKIQELQNSLKQIQPTPAGIQGEYQRPHIHLTLKASSPVHETEWNGKVLSWRPDAKVSGGLIYDSERSTISVQEEGAYFVYNQVYVVRVLDEEDVMSKEISNHTVIHAIYKMPFNFPRTQTPPLVTESAVSHCWNVDAKTQIQTSYQGMIVRVSRGEKLLAGVEYYDETVDQLHPWTFFGMFKL